MTPPRRWSDEDLRKAAGEETSLRGVMRALGLSDRSSTASIKQHMDRLGIPTERFRQLYYSDEALAEAVRMADSVTGVLRGLGIAPAGGSHAHISRRIRRMGLDTSHFHSRGRSIPNSLRKGPKEIFVRLPKGSRRTRPYQLRRALIEAGRPHRCAGCDVGPLWQGKELVLHVEHLDGDSMNCLQENLEFLCPNCHSQTASYARKKG